MGKFFEDPTDEPATLTRPEPTPEPVTQPTAEPTGGNAFFDVWDSPTEEKEVADDVDLDDDDYADDIDDTEGQDEMPMDHESADFAAGLAVGFNQLGMSTLLRWMHGEGEVSDYRADNEEPLYKAWYRFFKIMNIKITANRGVFFANVVAFGWSFGMGVYKLLSRIISGSFRWPWSRKKKAAQPEPDPFADLNTPDPIDITHHQPPPTAPNLNGATQQATKAAKKPVAPPPPPPEFNICLKTGERFTPGTGFPRSKKHEYHDKFKDRAAWQHFLEDKKKADATAKAAGKTESRNLPAKAPEPLPH